MDRPTQVPVKPEKPEPVPISSSYPSDVVSSQTLGDISFVRSGRIIPRSRTFVSRSRGDAVRQRDQRTGDEGIQLRVMPIPIVGSSVGLLDRGQKVA